MEIGAPSTWLNVVARNKVRTQLRDEARHAAGGGAHDDVVSRADEAPGSEPSLDERPDRSRLDEALDELPIGLRQIAELLRVDVPLPEAAERLGITLNALYARNFRLRQKLGAYAPKDPEFVDRAVEAIQCGPREVRWALAAYCIQVLARNPPERDGVVECLGVDTTQNEIRRAATRMAAEKTLARSLARHGIAPKHLRWFLNAERLSRCPKLEWYVYDRIVKPMVATLVRATPPTLLAFAIRHEARLHDAAPEMLRRFAVHYELMLLAVGLDWRLAIRGALLYFAESCYRRDSWGLDVGDAAGRRLRDTLDRLHNPEFVDEFFNGLIQGSSRLRPELEAERWVAIACDGLHIASEQLGRDRVEVVSPRREEFLSMARLSTCFARVVTGYDEEAFVAGEDPHEKRRQAGVRAYTPAVVMQSRATGGVRSRPDESLLPLIMRCLEGDGWVSKLGGVRHLAMMPSACIGEDFAREALPRLDALVPLFRGHAPLARLLGRVRRVCWDVLEGDART